MNNAICKWLLLATLALCIVLFFWLMPENALTLATLKQHQAALNVWVAQQPVLSAVLFFLLYMLVAALSIPGATVLGLLGGALFGVPLGVVIISFASTLGATLAMLTSRYLLHGWVHQRFTRQMQLVDTGMQRDGVYYLFALRLTPVFPFFLINLLMGLTRLPVRTYWWVSQLGMLPGTIVYVNAGRQLGKLDSLAGIVSPGLIGAFVLLGLLPLLSHRLLAYLSKKGE